DQEAGTYRLRRRDDDRWFGYAVGQHSWKERFFLPEVTLWKVGRHDGTFVAAREQAPAERLALLDVRPCDLAAIAIQDRIFVHDRFADPIYCAKRSQVFVVAVNCAAAGGTCFCVSMGTGPRAMQGFDLALTELTDGAGHRFLVEIGSEAGARILGRVGPVAVAGQVDTEAAAALCAATAAHMGRVFDNREIQRLLYGNLEHPRWKDVASRCLACTNCTLVCPTCFCATTQDLIDIDGRGAEQKRYWDSCFTMGHSYIHGGSVRASHLSRYRQWLVHKVCSWIDQFGMSGCVGCGRCITWCPVGIDITEEVAAIRQHPAAQPPDNRRRRRGHEHGRS
ncbi:MAG: 4Fe-4S dicluster domain-containing protein, partial [Pseudomonadota bacterium]